jgi:hypothetical protein
MTDREAIAEENRRIRELRRTVDLALFLIRTAPMTRRRAENVAASVRAKALDLFPDKGDAFDLIYQPRFNRVLDERFGLH